LCSSSYLSDLKKYVVENDLYLEWGGGQHIPRNMQTWDKKDVFDINQKSAQEAEILGTRIVRSCSGGLMRWDKSAPSTPTFLREMASALIEQRSMLHNHNVILAIETHFEFTTFELYRLFEMCEAEPADWLGICLDTMNLLTMLEDPAEATKRILPWVVSTHIKDGGIKIDEKGLTTFTSPIGEGIVNLKEIIILLETLPRQINLSIEDHGGSFFLPVYDPDFLTEFPDLTASEFIKLTSLASETRKKDLKILEREKWPLVCEARIQQDLVDLGRILRS
jgi:sugar phosphate isomerase/epimerase